MSKIKFILYLFIYFYSIAIFSTETDNQYWRCFYLDKHLGPAGPVQNLWIDDECFYVSGNFRNVYMDSVVSDYFIFKISP